VGSHSAASFRPAPPSGERAEKGDDPRMAERKSFLLRIDPALWTELEAWAQDELRSVNGQIEYVLKQAVIKRKGTQAVQRAEPSESNPSEGV
jgi:hypothetical protein